MAYELREGQGTLHKNTRRREGKNDPHYTGKINAGGAVRWFKAWLKDGRAGKWMSCQIGDPVGEKKAGGDGFEDRDIPF